MSDGTLYVTGALSSTREMASQASQVTRRRESGRFPSLFMIVGYGSLRLISVGGLR